MEANSLKVHPEVQNDQVKAQLLATTVDTSMQLTRDAPHKGNSVEIVLNGIILGVFVAAHPLHQSVRIIAAAKVIAALVVLVEAAIVAEAEDKATYTRWRKPAKVKLPIL